MTGVDQSASKNSGPAGHCDPTVHCDSLSEQSSVAKTHISTVVAKSESCLR